MRIITSLTPLRKDQTNAAKWTCVRPVSRADGKDFAPQTITCPVLDAFEAGLALNQGFTIVDVPHDGCHFPTGVSRLGVTLFCGEPVAIEPKVHPYCAAHLAISRYTPKPAKPAKVIDLRALVKLAGPVQPSAHRSREFEEPDAAYSVCTHETAIKPALTLTGVPIIVVASF
jgi:hypothetical protein